jgi:hypothetical protein
MPAEQRPQAPAGRRDAVAERDRFDENHALLCSIVPCILSEICATP